MEQDLKLYEKFVYSMTGVKFYGNFLKQGLKKAVFYLIALTLCSSILLAIPADIKFKNEYSSFTYIFNNTCPDFKIEDDGINLDYDNFPLKFEPDITDDNAYLYTVLTGDIIITDPTGNTTESVLDTYTNATFINKDSIFLKRSGQVIKYSLLDFKGLTKSDLSSFLGSFGTIMTVSLYIAQPIMELLSNCFVVFAFIGPLLLIFTKQLRAHVRYSHCCTIACYSITLPVVISTIVAIASGTGGISIYLTTFIGYFYALFAIKRILFDKKNINTNI